MQKKCLPYIEYQNIGFAAKVGSKNYGITDDILGGPAFWPKIITDNYYVSVTNADIFVEDSQSLPAPSPQFTEFMRGINEESDPIVTFATRKK